jgi:hypothetical protein
MTGGPDRLQAHLSVTVEAGGVRPIVGSVSTLSTPPEEMGQSLPLAPRPLFSTKDPPFLNADIYNPNLSPTSPCLCFLACSSWHSSFARSSSVEAAVIKAVGAFASCPLG